MAERRTMDPAHLDGVVETGHVVVSQEVKDEIDAGIKSGRFKVEDGRVLYHDPELRRFSASDTYPVNLNGGYLRIVPPDGVSGEPFISPINLEPLAYLRQLARWQPPHENP